MESQFPIGAPVEITSDDVGHRGALFLGKIVSPVSYDNKFEVEYETKMNETGQPLRKRVHVGLLRPPQPSETDRDFEFGDLVDAFFVGAWWEGSITKVLDDSRYVVYFRSVRSEFEIRKSNMRLHRELVKGNWVSHLQNQNVHDSEGPKQSTANMTAYVKNLLQQMQSRFQTMSDFIVMKTDEMGSGINELEESINDLSTEMAVEGSPSPVATPNPKSI
ncbi:protein AGENET DOMAIN (AGD)-CONTAINING P1-like isoform X2 [Tripterygium wilfordii]|uniref:protein AGENET DOMAIN (AGD)-CONTAINING P1-like isoform X2 n=1 Tax=Tripterygium wilfordii TaxID=458696 RepID=UPI0018F85C5A|nr:protein AGENET DOMAIN (AGD)-CONTAINING P1-like isoform X2 [Tripterygium wilfordii]